MGLFSTKKKTYVNTSVSRMVDDEDIVPSSKIAVLDFIMSQHSSSTRVSADSMSDYIIRAGINNIVARAKKSRNFSKRSSYAYGLTESNLVSRAEVDIKAAIQDSLEKVYPQGVLVKDAYFGPMNNFYFLKPILNNKYGYDYDTNELITESKRIGFKCYMESAVIKYSKYSTEALVDPDTIKQVGLSAEAGYTPFRSFNPNATQVPWESNYAGDYDIAVVTVVYADAKGDKKTYTITINYLDYERSSKPPETGLDDADTNNIEPDAVTPKVEDTLDGKDFYQANYEYTENGKTKTSTFIYLYKSGLDSKLDNLFNVTDTFGSYIPRIYARMDGMACNDSSLKNTDKYKAMVGLCKQLGMNWSEWVDEIHKSVGSVGDVSQIFMTYSLPANTKDPLIQEYLFEYFMGLYGRIPNVFATTEFADLRSDMVSYGSKQGQSIQIQDKVYTQQLNFKSIGYMDISGSIGKVGTVTSGHTSEIVNTAVRPTTPFRATSSITYHWYRKQMTEKTYREVRVYGLSSTEVVSGGYTTTASAESENLLVPLDMAVEHEFSFKEKELLYTKSMHIILNTIKVVKKKWYQTGIFKAIMFVVAVVVGYFFPPAGVAAMSWLAAAYAVAYAVAINLVISVAVKLLVSLGLDVGVVAAVVAVVALILGGYAAISKSGSVVGVTTKELLQASSAAFNISSQGYAIQTQNAVKEFNSLMTDLTNEQKRIQEQAKELGVSGSNIVLFESPISVDIKIGESPDDYYDRSIRVNNYAGAIYSLIESSVDIGLTLPTSQHTLARMQENINELSILGV